MFGFFKKKLPVLKYTDWTKLYPNSIVSIFIQGVSRGLEPAYKTRCDYLYSDYGILETSILIFSLLRAFDLGELNGIRDDLYRQFLEASAIIFLKDKQLEEIANKRGEKYFPLIKANNNQMLHSLMLGYAEMGSTYNMIYGGNSHKMITDMQVSLFGGEIVQHTSDIMLKATIKLMEQIKKNRVT